MLQRELPGLDIGRVSQTDGYLPAVSLIPCRAGGLGNLQNSGLARILCMCVTPVLLSVFRFGG